MGYPDHLTIAAPGLSPELRRLVRTCQSDPDRLVETLSAEVEPDPTGQLCATAWVLDRSATSVVLVRHRTLGWSVPGGHIELGERPWAALRRELAEETGLVVSAREPRPAFVHVAVVPASPRGPQHTHWSIGYVVRADADEELHGEEGQPARWWTLDELPDHRPDDISVLLPVAIDLSDVAVTETDRP